MWKWLSLLTLGLGIVIGFQLAEVFLSPAAAGEGNGIKSTQGPLLKVQMQDLDHNGVIEAYRLLSQDIMLFEVRDANQDGVLDSWEYYNEGRLEAIVEDRNYDGRPDRWERRGSSGEAIIALDDDFDGTIDRQGVSKVIIMH